MYYSIGIILGINIISSMDIINYNNSILVFGHLKKPLQVPLI